MSKIVVAAYVVGIVAAATVVIVVPAGAVGMTVNATGAFVLGTVITIKFMQFLGFQA